MSDDIGPSGLDPAELVAYLHPVGETDHRHSVAAAQQVRELLRYLNTVAAPEAARRAYPDPAQLAKVLDALQDGMRHAAEMFDSLAGRTDQFARSPHLYAVAGEDAHPGGGAHYVEQAALEMAGVACRCDELAADLAAVARICAEFGLAT